MAQHRRKNRSEQEETEEEKRHKKRTNQLKYDRLKAPDEGTIPAADFSVEPSADKHAALLANIPSDEQRAGLVTQLQQSYGNAYVQQVMERIQAGKSPGKPLERDTRSEMEAAFNKDLGDVRIHIDTEADQLSRELGAKAFTAGKDIFFRKGAYQPSSEEGKSLLGHELTHALQQKSGIQAGNTIGRAGDALEQEAALAGRAVSEGHPVSVETASAAPALQRQAAGAPPTAAKDSGEEASTGGPETTKSNLPPGPYTGWRLKNDLMDPFEYKQNIFAPHVFKHYGKNRSLWEPLDGLIETYWVKNEGNWSGIRLGTPALKKAAWALLNGVCTDRELAIIKGNAEDRGEEDALLEAIYVEHKKQYTPAHKLAEDEWWKSNFRLYHEWSAVKYGFVSWPYAYFAKKK